MAAPTTTRLRDALRDLLTASAACLTDPPARRYISAGPPALVADCEVLAVYPALPRALTLDQPGEIPSPRGQPRVRVTGLVVELHRCVSKDVDPPLATLDAEGVQHAVDGWSLFAGLIYRLQQDLVFTTLSSPDLAKSANVDLAEVIEPSGGFAGWRVQVQVAL